MQRTFDIEPSRSCWLPLILLGLLLSVAAAGMAQQVEEENLPLDEATPPEVWQGIQQQFDEATEVFRSREQERSIELFTVLIEAVANLPVATEAEVMRREELLAQSLSYRARACANFRKDAQSHADLEELIRLQPQFEMDRSEASPKLLDQFDRMKRQMVGFLEVLVVPSDADVTVDGREFDNEAGPVAILAGDYAVTVDRPGYDTYLEDVSVAADQTKTVEIELVRSSAVVVLRTWPRDATILLDGVEVGQTDRPTSSDWVPTGEAARRSRDEFGELVLGGLELGERRIEVVKEGYRTYPGSIRIDEIRDVVLQPVILELQAGTIVLGDLPTGVTVRANGKQVAPEWATGSSPKLVLPPGEYQISIRHDGLGVFETRTTVRDDSTVTVEVALRPGLVLMGILGDDRVGAEKIRQGLKRELEARGHWTLLDRSGDGPQLLAGIGVEAERLRIMGDLGQIDGVDWQRAQAVADAQTPGSVYVLAVLSDDLVASAADLWIWPAAPGSSRPDLRRVPLDDDAALGRLADAFSPALAEPRMALGFLLVDSEAAAGPLIADLTPGGAGAEAGLAVGDEITALDGAPMLTTSQFEAALQQLAGKEPGTTAELEVRSGSGGATRRVRVKPRAVPHVVDLADPNRINAAVAAEVAAELSRNDLRWPSWVLELNRAAVLLQSGAFEDAVRALREIEAPIDAHFGQAAVDYLTGVALEHSDARYADRARDAYSKAAQDAEGRLMYEDGPLVSPRARARLAGLGGG